MEGRCWETVARRWLLGDGCHVQLWVQPVAGGVAGVVARQPSAGEGPVARQDAGPVAMETVVREEMLGVTRVTARPGSDHRE